jgi:hypothetical protein
MPRIETAKNANTPTRHSCPPEVDKLWQESRGCSYYDEIPACAGMTVV